MIDVNYYETFILNEKMSRLVCVSPGAHFLLVFGNMVIPKKVLTGVQKRIFIGKFFNS